MINITIFYEYLELDHIESVTENKDKEVPPFKPIYTSYCCSRLKQYKITYCF